MKITGQLFRIGSEEPELYRHVAPGVNTVLVDFRSQLRDGNLVALVLRNHLPYIDGSSRFRSMAWLVMRLEF